MKTDLKGGLLCVCYVLRVLGLHTLMGDSDHTAETENFRVYRSQPQELLSVAALNLLQKVY